MLLAPKREPLRSTRVAISQEKGCASDLGELMATSRDQSELEASNLAHCPPPEYINGYAWFAEVGFEGSAGLPIRFQVVVLRPDGADPVYESLNSAQHGGQSP